MSLEDRSVRILLTDLESQVEKLRQSVVFHEQQEEHHREQKIGQKEKLAVLEERLTRFREAASAVLEVAEVPPAPPQREVIEDWGSMSRPKVGRMIERVIADHPAEAGPFGASAITREVNRRFGDRMRRTLDSRQVSVSLRRLEERGRLRRVRKGRSYSEALYERGEG